MVSRWPLPRWLLIPEQAQQLDTLARQIAIVEDEPAIAQNLRDAFARHGDLAPEELAIRDKVREFAEQRVLPIINGYWERAEFPDELLPGLAEIRRVIAVEQQGHGRGRDEQQHRGAVLRVDRFHEAPKSPDSAWPARARSLTLSRIRSVCNPRAAAGRGSRSLNRRVRQARRLAGAARQHHGKVAHTIPPREDESLGESVVGGDRHDLALHPIANEHGRGGEGVELGG